MNGDMMLYDEAKNIEEKVAKIADEYEIFISQNNEIELDSNKNELNFAKDEISKGVGIRVIKDNKIGFAFTSDLNKIEETTKQALSNTKLNKTDDNFSFSTPEKSIEVKGTYDKRIDSLNQEEYIELLNSIIQKADETDCEVTSAGFSASKGETVILNSNGVSQSNKGTIFAAGLSVKVTRGEEISTAYDSIMSRKFDLNPEELSEEVCRKAIDSLGGTGLETDDYDVVLDYHAATGLLSTFIAAFSGENILRGRSILKDKMGEQITDENLSIINDSTLPEGLISCNCDGEGVVSRKTTLVENGELKSFLYDLYSANKSDTQSTSNGYRSGFSSTPTVAPSNLIFDFKDSADISDINNGVFVSSVLGAHTANPITGDFSVEGSNLFKIENGEITKPIKKAMVSGNIFELIKTAKKVDSKTKQYGYYIIPQILVHDLRVIGV